MDGVRSQYTPEGAEGRISLISQQDAAAVAAVEPFTDDASAVLAGGAVKSTPVIAKAADDAYRPRRLFKRACFFTANPFSASSAGRVIGETVGYDFPGTVLFLEVVIIQRLAGAGLRRGEQDQSFLVFQLDRA